LTNNVIETSNRFYVLSNALRYIQIKFHDHKFINLGTTVENTYSKIEKIFKILYFIVLIMTSSKIIQFFSQIKSTRSHLSFKSKINFPR